MRNETVAEDQVVLTREGLDKLRTELDYLRDVRRPEVAAALEQARESNLSTEAEPGYELAKEEQSIVERRIALLEDMILRAEVIDDAEMQASDHVRLGSTVVMQPDDGPEQTVRIVSPLEVDVAHGKISEESPVGRALLGHRVGDTVEVTVPAGQRRLRIMSLA